MGGPYPDITILERQAHDLHRMTRQHDLILNAMAEGVFGLDLEGRVQVVNRAAAEMTGWSAEEILGQDLHSVIHYAYLDGTPRAKESCGVTTPLREKRPHKVDLDLFWRKDGSSFPVRYTSHPIWDAGLIVGAVVTFLDETEHLQLQEQLQERTLAYTEATDSLRIRDQFLSVAAHELRSPITALLGYSQSLERRAAREQSLSERDQQAVRMISSQAIRLTKLIGTLLDMSLLQSGQLSLACQPVDLTTLLHFLVDELSPSAPQHQLSVDAPQSPIGFEGDAARLEQVFRNLIQNAIKYSPNGGDIRITLSAGDHGITIDVRDEGIGIPADSLPHLFTHLYRAPNVAEGQIAGTGIGLFVVKELVTLHGGTVAVTSAQGHGTTVSIFLPYQREAIPFLPDTSTTAALSSSRGYTA